MKKFTILVLSLIAFVGVFANPVDDSTAKVVGLNFLRLKVHSQRLGIVNDLKLAYKSVENSTTCFYVFNVVNGKGYVIVSADDNAKAILGYSDENNFSTERLPIQVKEWLGGYNKQISYIKNNKIIATDSIRRNWQLLKMPPSKIKFQDFGTSSFTSPTVAPLIQTLWDQNPNPPTYGAYDTLCPFDPAYGQKCVTGCVATAMAQVMKYWNYPAKGTGTNTYTPSFTAIGSQTVNFDSAIYQWNLMPNQLTQFSSEAEINAVATLMYDCGVSVNMSYHAANDSGGSGAVAINYNGTYSNTAQDALVNYFGYSKNIQGLQRSDYQNDGAWIYIIKNELNAKRPIIYTGQSTEPYGGGHCFVADGYDENDFIHFNWGWSGSDNGYYEIDYLNPENLGTGGGAGGFDTLQTAIIGIQPAIDTSYNIVLTTNITPSSTSIDYASKFNVGTSIYNLSSKTFTGDYCAAIFDEEWNFIDYVQILSSDTLKSNSFQSMTFSSNSQLGLEMIPGSYYIGVYYRSTGGNWIAVGNNASFSNFVNITVTESNTNIKLNSQIAYSPSTLYSGQSAAFAFDIVNNEIFTTYYGQYNISLYNLDGSLAQTLGIFNENNGLGFLQHYNPPLSCSLNSLKVKPGKYLLGVTDSSFSGSSWEITGGSSSYINPITVNVLAPISPDKYEPNNSVNKAYLLPLNFVNNKAYINTSGSNINSSSDSDYYKIQLPLGYNYSIKPVLNDEEYSSSDSTFTLNGLADLFAFNGDSISYFSGNFQDTLIPSSSFQLSGGNTLYVEVMPFASGLTGTYLLEFNVTRTPTLPTVLGFSPQTASTGNQVKITGSGFTTATAVKFGKDTASSFQIVNDSSIIAVVGKGASGYVEVDNPSGSDTMGGFTYSSVPVNGLLAWYPFNGDANDSSGNGFNGVMNGGDFATDRFGNINSAMELNGTSDYVSLPNNNNMFNANQQAFTVISWINLANTLDNTIKYVYYNGIPEYDLFYYKNSIGFGVKLSDGNWYFINYQDSSHFNKWICIVGVYNQGKSISFYENGKLLMSTPLPNISLGTGGFQSRVGNYGLGDGTQNCSGSIDDIRIYNRALDSTEIQSLYNEGGYGYPSPSIVSFSPTTATTGTTDTIKGSGFTGATTVSFGGTGASSFTVISDSIITAVVGNGASGSVYVTTGFGTDSLSGFKFCVPTTSIKSSSICLGSSYTFNGSIYSSAGTYQAHLTNSTGCDSLAVLVLTINQPTKDTISTAVCGSYFWHGKTYTTSGSYSFDSLNAKGCDSLTTLNLTIKQPSKDTVIVSTASIYKWHDSAYNKSGIYTFDTLNSVGCDSITTLILTSSLPISYIDFSAKYEGNIVSINWTTVTELSTNLFIIQHSTDGNSFTDIGSVKAIGSGANSYSFTDNKPSNGINYYRLQSVDNVGAVTYSKLVSVDLYKDNKFTIAPNPAKNTVNLSFKSPIEATSIAVYDITGRLVLNKLIRATLSNYKLDVATLSDGIYVVKVNGKNSLYNQRLVISK